MCLLVVLSRVVPGAPLVVAANRDEAYARPAEATGLLRESPRTVGSRDLLAGGTALAVTDGGLVAGLTNKPSGGRRDPSKRSRGEIPLALTDGDSAAAAVEAFAASVDPAAFNPCWALAGDRGGLLYLDLTVDDRVEPRPLEPGVHVLENAPLEAPSAKVDHVRRLVGDPEEPGLLDRLRALLRDHHRPEGAISSPCVHTEPYGTRSSTLVTVPDDPSATPAVWASHGPSCEHPLERVAYSAST